MDEKTTDALELVFDAVAEIQAAEAEYAASDRRVTGPEMKTLIRRTRTAEDAIYSAIGSIPAIAWLVERARDGRI